MRVAPLRQTDAVIQYRLQDRRMRRLLNPKTFPRICPAKSRYGTDTSCLRLPDSLVLLPGIDADLVNLLLPLPGGVRTGRQDVLYPEAPGSHPHMRQAVSLRVAGDLIHPCAESAAAFFRTSGFYSSFFRLPGTAVSILPFSSFHAGHRPAPCIPPKPLKKLMYSLKLESRSEITREDLPLRDQTDDGLILYAPAFQIFLKYGILTHSQFFIKRRFVLVKREAVLVQTAPDIPKEPLPVRPFLVHLIDKQKHRDPVSQEQLPERPGMPLHPVHPVDDQNRIIQHLERALHLRREIHMPRRIKKRHLTASKFKHRLLGEDCYPPASFQLIGIQIRILMIHASQFPDLSAKIQDPL